MNVNRKNTQIIHIQPVTGWVAISFQELWDYRELIYFLTWRDIKVRYKQTVLGASWAILQPFITMVIFSLFFGKLAKMPSDGIPYPIFSYAALVPWTFFANGVSKASTSLVGGSGLLKKVYFPRLAMPISGVSGGVLDFVLAFIVLLAMMLYYNILPTINILWLPLLLILAYITSLGVSLWLSALNVQFRDIRYIVPFIIQAWMFATPVVYPASLITDPFWKIVYSLNPMVGVIEGFRWALLDTDSEPSLMIIASSLIAILILVGGTIQFRRLEKTFADVA